MQDYDYTAGHDIPELIELDKQFLRVRGPLTLWVQFRNQSRKFMSVSFFLVDSPAEDKRVFSTADMPIVDVSLLVARIAGLRVDNHGGARVPLVKNIGGAMDPITGLVRFSELLSLEVFGEVDRVVPRLLMPVRYEGVDEVYTHADKRIVGG